MNADDKALIEIVKAVVTWALVVAGWAIAYITSGWRERRKENVGVLETIEARVEELRGLAEVYYTTPFDSASDRKRATEIKYKLKSLAGRVRVAQARGYDLSSELIAFRQAVTLHGFESSSRRVFEHDDAVIQRIWMVTDNFANALWLEHEANTFLRSLAARLRYFIRYEALPRRDSAE